MLKTHKNNQKFDISLVLSDLRSIQNTASMFRIADCLGITDIHLVGTTPSPLDKYKRLRPDFAKISLGSESIHYTYHDSIIDCINDLIKMNYIIVGIEQHETSIDYKQYKPDIASKYAVILFNEPHGAHISELCLCDIILEIPQYGKKESLNVTSAGGIALFRLFDR